MDNGTDHLSRREFVTHGIAAGFALSCLPISAWALTTPADGLVAGTIQIPTSPGGPMPAYRARPAANGTYPTIIVIHEIFGVHEYIQDVCRRLAKLGYVAIAPSLYFREGDVTKIADMSKVMEVVKKVPQAQVWADIDALVAFLPKLDEPAAHSKWTPPADPARLGIMGFCWGGGTTWTTCAHNPAFKAGVAWYGPLAGSPTPMQKQFPLDIAATLKTPVLGLYGGKDSHITADQRDKMKAALATGSSGSEIVVYPDAEHGFHADYRPSYNQKDAVDGWARALAWFKEHGVS